MTNDAPETLAAARSLMALRACSRALPGCSCWKRPSG